MKSNLTTTHIKNHNKLRILKCIRNFKESTQPEIAKKLKISRPTVSSLIEELIAERYIQISGIGSSTEQGGKRPKLISFNPSSRAIISIHIGVEIMDGALLDLDANILFRIKVDTQPQDGQKKVLEKIFDIAEQLFKKVEELNITVLGIGIGSPGLIDTDSGTILNSSNFSILNNVKIGQLFTEKFNKPIWIENECRNLALAENLFGVGRNTENFVSLTTDIGIGAGIIINNQIIRGANNSFGEIGHTIIMKDGPLCRCGNRGCWETLASSSALLNRVSEQINKTSQLKEMISSERGLSIPLIIKAVQQGDQAVWHMVYEFAEFLSIGIVNIVNIFNPQIIFIHGEISELGAKLIEQIENKIKEKALPTPASRVKIKYSTFGRDANIIGSAALVIKELFDDPDYFFSIS